MMKKLAQQLAWLKRLPEVGSAFYGDRLERAAWLDAEIQRKMEELAALKRTADKLVKDSERAALTQWSADEIKLARFRAHLLDDGTDPGFSSNEAAVLAAKEKEGKA